MVALRHGGSWSGSRIFFFQAEDGIRDLYVTGVQTCALPILSTGGHPATAVLPLAAWIAHRRTEKRKLGRVNKCVRTLRTCKSEKQYADPVPNPPDSLKK